MTLTTTDDLILGAIPAMTSQALKAERAKKGERNYDEAVQSNRQTTDNGLR